jgi:chitinase|tara:strand:+ start:1520 stop:2065 length:546 start_codon:yes stop_codon:yes gene_type:complete
MIKKDIVFRGIAEFILDNKELVIEFLNTNNYADLSLGTPVDEVNKAVANNMLDEDFIAEFLLFQRRVEEGNFQPFIVAITTAVSIIAETIQSMVMSAKNKIFAEDMARRNEQYGREDAEFYRELAELNARKGIAIELGKAQTNIILERDMAEEKAKTMNNLLIFGVAITGALTIAYILRKK